MALITPNFRELGFFPKNSLSKSESHANQGKESTATARGRSEVGDYTPCFDFDKFVERAARQTIANVNSHN
jgi:hypothetical protein